MQIQLGVTYWRWPARQDDRRQVWRELLPLSADIDPSRGERHGSPIIGRNGVGLPRPGVGTFFAFGGLRIVNVLLTSR